MEVISQLAAEVTTLAQQEMLFITWRDIIEIAFFTVTSYRIVKWLNKDTQKNLARYFYLYCALALGSYYANLHVISLVLFFGAPIVAVLFLILHQQTLQKNFIVTKSLTQKPDASDKWLEEIIQASLRGVNKNKTVICVIERTDALNVFLTAQCTFNAPVTHELLDLLMNTTPDDEMTTLWVSHTGLLIAINPHWHAGYDEIWASQQMNPLHRYKQDALLISQKSDAIITVISPETRLFDVLVGGKGFDNISAGYAFSLIKQHIATKQVTKGNAYATLSKKGTDEQLRT